MSRNDFWMSVLKRLQPTIKKAHFLTWFQNSAVLELNDDEVVVGLPTTYAESWILSKYDVKILQAAQEISPEIKKITYKVDGTLETTGAGLDVKAIFKDETEKKVRKVRNANEVNVVKAGTTHKVSSQLLNSRYGLDSFVCGNDNSLPHAASNAVANMPGGIYNPLYIYGSVGLGKTHLLQGIGNEIIKKFPDLVVKYITAEKFVTEVVEAIGKRYMKQFKAQYRNVDVFLIDDIQFFARKDSSQQEFFHTFNELYQNNKQIVLTSDRPPSELDDLDARLKSRFSMGMVVELIKPEYETRLAILNQKCRANQVIIDPDVLNFIAMNVTNSVRELKGVLRQLICETQLFNRVPTIPAAAKIIKRMNSAHEMIGYNLEGEQKRNVPKSAIQIMEAVATYYHLTVDDLVGKSRQKDVAIARQVGMYLVKKELGYSYEKIGLGFGGRNHTTVMHACNKTAQTLQADVRLMRDINAMKSEMGL